MKVISGMAAVARKIVSLNRTWCVWPALLVLCVFLLPAPSFGQTSASSNTEITWPTTGSDVPEGWSDEDFPGWANDLRRFEVVTLGSWPLSFLVSSLGYDIGRWAFLAGSGDSNASLYAPSFFAPPGKPAYTSDEVLSIVWISAGLSAGIGLLDWFLGLAEKEKSARARADRAEASQGSMDTGGIDQSPEQEADVQDAHQ